MTAKTTKFLNSDLQTEIKKKNVIFKELQHNS